ncbi:MAG: branched-chain alpha-keto acid dehydrogenase subunit E2, partial [Methylococcaceae bacterium]|nr:branched-chain alpha-keto acid dehydrogenase subunit E2 [Methylococcaceae bacterium]
MSSVIEIKVPDLGNVAEIDIIDVPVSVGDVVVVEQTLAVMETDKATMDLPSSAAGKIVQLHIKVGDKVAQGTLVATVELGGASAPTETAPAPKAEKPAEAVAAPVAPAEPPKAAPAAVVAATPVSTEQTSHDGLKAHATPSVRLFA